MTALGIALVALPLALGLYAYLGYPLLLLALRRKDGEGYPRTNPEVWPTVSISLPAYNEEGAIASTLDALLALDYPCDRMQILVISDASTDRTDEIVRSYADRGVELLRLPARSGKTAAENAGAARLAGDIVVNTDATIRLLPGSLKPLARCFQDPTIGCASGRDVSVAPGETDPNVGESGYVGYEMWVRALETRAGYIVGASGCYYGIRRALHLTPLPDYLSRDFAAALITREAGLRAVSVDDAVSLVPRTGSLDREFRRKVRTMARGLQTLWFKRHLLNPLRHGRFALMLFSHKLCRWLVPLALPLSALGLALLAPSWRPAGWILFAFVFLAGLGLWSLLRSDKAPLSRPLAMLAFVVGTQAAAIVAWFKAVVGERNAFWEPTRR